MALLGLAAPAQAQVVNTQVDPADLLLDPVDLAHVYAIDYTRGFEILRYTGDLSGSRGKSGK